MPIARKLAWLLPLALVAVASPSPADDPAPAAPAEVKLDVVDFDAYLARVAANKGAKVTMVDAWATWCSPCMENFPHVVEMHKKYAGQGLAVVSLSLDDPTVPKAKAAAERFLKSKGATFTNLILAEEPTDAFDKLDTSGVPAVFFFGPDGKEIFRFTGDDADKPFTYDDVGGSRQSPARRQARADQGVRGSPESFSGRCNGHG